MKADGCGGRSLVCDSQKCCAKQLLNNGHDQPGRILLYIIHIGRTQIYIYRMSSRSFFYERNNGRHMNYGEGALGLTSGLEFAWKSTKLTTHHHHQHTEKHTTATHNTNHTLHCQYRLLLDSFMQHLTRPLPLHRTLFAPMPFAPLAPLEPLRALPSQRVASVWAAPPPAPLAAQQPQSPHVSLNAPLLPIYNSNFGSDHLGDTEFVPLEQQQQGPQPGPLQGRQDAVASAQTTTSLEQRPFSKLHSIVNTWISRW